MATSTVDAELWNVPYPPVKAANRDKLGRQGITELFARRVKGELSGLLSGTAIVMDGTPLPAGDVAADATLLIRSGGVTRPMLLSGAIQSAINLRGFVTSADLGLVGDGVTDDAPALQKGLDLWGSRGGAAFLLRANDGQSFRLNGRVTVRDGCSVNFSSPVLAGKGGGIRISGKRANALTDDKAFALLVDATLAGTTLRLDTAPLGGGALSTHLAAGDRLAVYGQKDSAGYAFETADLRVTVVDDSTSTVTVSSPLPFLFRASYPAGAYEAAWSAVDRTRVEKMVTGSLTTDLIENNTLVQLTAGHSSRFAAGDLVTIEDDSVAGDNGGDSELRTHMEPVRIEASVSGDPAGSVRLARRVQRTYTVAKSARLVKIEPVKRASVAGCSVAFAQAPDPDPTPRVNTFEVAYADECKLESCEVPNEDLFGSRGNAFRVFRSISCQVNDCAARDSKFVSAGDGNGVAFVNSYGCAGFNFRASRMRHGVLWLGATDCSVFAPIIEANRHTPLDWHGGNSVGCWAYSVTLTAGTAYEAEAGASPQAATFGNPSHLGGDRECGIDGGRITGFGTGVTFFAPSSDVKIKNVEFTDCKRGVVAWDLDGFGALVTRGVRLERCSFDGCTDWAIDIDGKNYGAVANAVQDLALVDCGFRRCSMLMRLYNADELEIINANVDDCTVLLTDPYALKASGVSGLLVRSGWFRGIKRGISLNNVTGGAVLRNDFLNQDGDTIVLLTQGANDVTWARNEYAGFQPTVSGSLVGFTVLNDDLPLS